MKRLPAFLSLLVSGCLIAASAQAGMLTDDQLAARQKASWLGRLRGSYASLTTYLGTGSFIRNEYSDNPYAAEELLLYPRFKVANNMDVRAYWILNCEFTQPDIPNGRHCDPSDLRLSFHDSRLWTDPWIKGYFFANGQLWLPTSFESRFNHTVLNLRVAGGYLTRFFRDRLEVSYALAIQKYFPTQPTRGYRAGDQGDSGIPLFSVRASSGADAAAGSGGPMNDNWLFINSFHVSYAFIPKLSLSVDLLIYNYIRFSVPEAASSPELVTTGRSDSTWGIIELDYQLKDYLMLGLGISSLQPAKTADSKSIRFPFYDFISPYNNYTKWYLAATVLY